MPTITLIGSWERRSLTAQNGRSVGGLVGRMADVIDFFGALTIEFLYIKGGLSEYLSIISFLESYL